MVIVQLMGKHGVVVRAEPVHAPVHHVRDPAITIMLMMMIKMIMIIEITTMIIIAIQPVAHVRGP